VAYAKKKEYESSLPMFLKAHELNPAHEMTAAYIEKIERLRRSMNLPPFDHRTFLKTVPLDPGVYLMKDSAGEIIYIGKASSLRKRVSSYFSQKEHDFKTAALVRNIAAIEYIITDSEIEASSLKARSCASTARSSTYA
jgi:hypothetical protein